MTSTRGNWWCGGVGGGVGGRREGGPCGEPLRLNLMITLSFPVDTASGLLSGPSK